MAEIALTQSIISTYQADTKKIRLHDATQPGLFLEIRPSNGRTFYVRYKSPRGQWKELRLGSHPDLTLAQARQRAREVRAAALLGEDPADAAQELKKIPTFDSFFTEQYVTFKKLSKLTLETDVSLYKNHIKHHIGHLHLDQIEPKHIQKIAVARKEAGAAPGSINRVLILLRTILSYALRIQTAGVKRNVAKDIPLVKDNSKMDRYLQPHELQPLKEAIEASENPMLKYIVLALIYSGTRKREVLDAKWEDFDFHSGKWKIPVTKNGEPREIPINDGLKNVLLQLKDAALQFTDTPYVFANPKTGLPFISIYYSWDTARRQAGLAGFRIHDLRHSFASFLINNGRSLYEVQKLLGHKSPQMTQRYAHLTERTLMDASNTMFKSVSGLINNAPARLEPIIFMNGT